MSKAEAVGRIVLAHYQGEPISPVEESLVLGALPEEWRVRCQGHLCLGCILQKIRQRR